MSANGRTPDTSTGGRVLRWPGRVLAAADLRHRLDGHGELVLGPGTVLTPLAAEELAVNGVRVTREGRETKAAQAPLWGYGQDRAHPLVRSAVQALARDGLALRPPPAGG